MQNAAEDGRGALLYSAEAPPDDRAVGSADAAICRRQERTSHCASVFSLGRFLRTLLRRRDPGGKGTADYSDFAEQRKRNRGSDVRRALSRGGGLHREADSEGLQGRDLRANGGSATGEETGAPRSHACGYAGNCRGFVARIGGE